MKNKLKINSWSEKERNRLVTAFDWLLEEDKKQNPDLYKLPKGVVLDRNGNQVKL